MQSKYQETKWLKIKLVQESKCYILYQRVDTTQGKAVIKRTIMFFNINKLHLKFGSTLFV